MDQVHNPYSPGAGRQPAALVGRDSELEEWRVGLRRAELGRSPRPLALYGLRGVGKTVLLNRMRADAEHSRWVTAKVEAGAGKSLREALGESLYAPLSDLVRPSPGRRLLKALRTALSFKASYDLTGTWNFGIDLSEGSGGADSGVLESDLTKLVRDLSLAAGEERLGFAILVDEAQDLHHDEMVALCSVSHVASQENWPFLLAVAGLPGLPRDLAEAKSYAERLFQYHHVHALEDELASQALIEPARLEGVSWEADASRFVLEAAVGYPYFLQQFGEASWNDAQGPTITIENAKVGTARGMLALDTGFFRSRWDRATPGEQEYLRAMAMDGDAGSLSGEVARRLKRRPNSLGPTRAKLIEKGLVYSPQHGTIAFTVPRMAEFIKRQPTN